MTQDILITPGSGEPQILFRGSGTNDTPIELNVLSSYQSATGSGTALVFEGQEGQLFAVTDNLSSGTIFSVGDITGLSMLSVDASGDVKLGEFANSVIVYPGLTLDDNVPSTTSNVLYNDGGDLMWNGVTVIQSGAAQAVDGSGTASYVARFTDTNTLGTGIIYDNGTNVGIGTASPNSKLEVNGEIAAGSAFTFVGNGWGYDRIIFRKDVNNKITSDANGNYKWYLQGKNLTFPDLSNDAKFGIWTDTPTQKVDIRYPASGGMALLKSTDTNDGLLFGDMAYSTSNNYQGIKHAAMSGSNDYMIISDGTNTFISAAAGYSTIIGAGGNNLSSQIQLKPTEVVVNDNSSNLDFRVESNNDANALFVDGIADRVGIGTGSPAAKLDVNTGTNRALIGSPSFTWGGNSSSTFPTLYSSNSSAWVMHVNPHISYVQNGVDGYTGNTNGATVRFASDTSATTFWDIGIGTNAVGTDKLSIGRGGSTNFLAIDNTGNVGIGTASPQRKLEVYGATNAQMAITSPNSIAYREILFYEGTTGIGDIFQNGSTQTNYAGAYSLNIANLQNAPIGFYTNGTANERMRITEGGNVGIGTTSPSSKLHVQGSSDQLRLSDGTLAFTVGYDNNYLRFKTSAGDTPVVVNWNTGNVGIGTTSPSEKLHVAGDVLIDGDGGTIAGATWDNGLLRIGTSSGGISIDTNEIYASHDLYLGALDTASAIIFRHATTERMRVASGGNIGIGTTSPQDKLHVNGGRIRIENVTDPKLSFNDGSANRSEIFYDTSEETFVLNHTDADANQLVLTSGNNVGIGTNDPNATLHVYSATSGENVFNVEGTNGSLFGVTDSLSGVLMSVNTIAGLPVLEVNSDYSVTAGRFNQNDFVITASGDVGMGTASPSYKLDVVGSNNTTIASFSDGTDGVQIATRGTARQQIDFVGSNAAAINAKASLYFNYDSDNNGSSDAIVFARNSNDESGTIDAIITEGKVGIGTASPTQQLDVRYPAGGGMALLKSTDTNDGLLFGDMAYSTSNTYQGIKHAAMGGANDYMMISDGTNTLVSAANGYPVYIRAGGNLADSEIKLTSTEVVVNDQGSSLDFRVESDNNANMLFVDGVTNMVGIGKIPGNAQLDVSGTFKYGNCHFSDTIYNYTNGILITTNVPANISTMFELTIEGNSYSGSTGPIFGRIQGYNYSVGPTILGWSFITTHTLSATLMHHNGYLAIWLQQPNSSTSFTFKFISSFDKSHYIMSITNVVKPTTNVTFSINISSNKIWTALNDGDSSGLDADLLDGQHGSYYQPLLTNPVTGTGTTNYVSKWTGATTQGNSLIFDNGTKVGIGTAVPTNLLHIEGNAENLQAYSQLYVRSAGTYPSTIAGIALDSPSSHQSHIRFMNNGTAKFQIRYNNGDTADDKLKVYSWTQTADMVTFDGTNGNVGIGTTSPTEKLHVMGGARLQGDITGTTWTNASPTLALKRSGDAPFISFHTNAGPRIGYLLFANASDSILNVEVNRGLRFLTNTTDRMYIAAGGNVGIGTTSPQQKLHVVGDQRIENATDPKLEFHDGAAVGAYVKFDTSEDNLVLSHVDVAGDNQIALANDGNVGIGTASPNAVLHAYGSTPSGTVFNVEGTNGSLFSVVDNLSGVLMSVNNNAGLPVFEVNDDDSIVGGRFAQNDFVVTTSGDIGMGTANPSSKLEVNGTVTATSFSGAGTGLTGTAASLTAGAVTNGVYTTGNQTVGGVKTFSSQIISTAANSTSTGGGQIYLNGATGNRIDFNANGVAAPTFTTRSAGTKIVLYPNITASLVDFAIGIESSTLWSSVPNSASLFKWYGGTTNIATLTGAGVLTVAGSTSQINVDNLRLDGNTLSSTNTNGNIIITPNGTGALQADGGGNARGAYAVDLQRVRGLVTQVASGCLATIAGGENNTAGFKSSVGGGRSNTASGSYSTVSGGISNASLGQYSTVSGGSTNTACAINSSVSGGRQNFVNARHGSINGGHYNVIQSPTNECCSRGATIGGGVGHNTSGGTVNSTTGDITDTVTCYNAGAFSTIGGGCRNIATGDYSKVGGGWCNTASGYSATLGGGYGNCSIGIYSTVAGGSLNCATFTRATVGGGASNCAVGIDSVIAGGRYNKSCGSSSTVGGGFYNIACGNQSTVSGGYFNYTSEPFSTIVGGKNAKASRYGEVAHAAGQFAQQGDAQHSTFVARIQTTAANNFELFLDGSSQRMNVPNVSMWAFTIKISAFNVTQANGGAWWHIRGGIQSDDGGDVSLVGSLIEESDVHENFGGSYPTISADTVNSSLKIQVSTDTSDTIRWVAVVDVAQVSGGTP